MDLGATRQLEAVVVQARNDNDAITKFYVWVDVVGTGPNTGNTWVQVDTKGYSTQIGGSLTSLSGSLFQTTTGNHPDHVNYIYSYLATVTSARYVKIQVQTGCMNGNCCTTHGCVWWGTRLGALEYAG